MITPPRGMCSFSAVREIPYLYPNPSGSGGGCTSGASGGCNCIWRISRRRDGIWRRYGRSSPGVMGRGECVSLGGLALDGKDLIELGVAPGPAVGDMLKRLMDTVLH